jgi:hypothetical protein
MLGMMGQHFASLVGSDSLLVSDNCGLHLTIATTEKFPGGVGFESCQF